MRPIQNAAITFKIFAPSSKQRAKGGHDQRLREYRQAGDSARDQKNWAAAIKFYEEVLKVDPSASDIAVQLGHARKEIGHYDRAAQLYLSVLALNPNDDDLHLQIGHLEKMRNDFSNALKFYKKVETLNPNNLNAQQEHDALISRLVDERSAALVERDAALVESDAARVERDKAHAACDDALSERNSALIARDAALEELKRCLIGAGRRQSIHEFRTPIDLGRTPTDVERVLVIDLLLGSLSPYVHRVLPGADATTFSIITRASCRSTPATCHRIRLPIGCPAAAHGNAGNDVLWHEVRRFSRLQ